MLGKTLMNRSLRRVYWRALILIAAGFLAIMTGCGKEKVIIRQLVYLEYQDPIDLTFPPPDTLITTNIPTFYWHSSDLAQRYQLHVSSSNTFITKTIDIIAAETTYTTQSEIPNGPYFWRVRGENADSVWSDWSEAEIRSFYKSDNVNYIVHLSNINTIGTSQDVFVRGDTAYVADSQADLTIVDITNRSSPFIIKNIDTIDDDFAKGVYVAPTDTFPYAFVADMDGHVQVINTADTTFLFNFTFGSQNIEDLAGLYISDTLYIFTVRSRSGFNNSGLAIQQIIYRTYPELGPLIVNPVDMPADAKGVTANSNFAYVACDIAGLVIVDISVISDPVIASILDLTGVSLSVYIDSTYAYIAADRSGLFVVDISDPFNPVAVSQVNTSGRTKDVHVSGDYAFIADGSGGLKVINISVPDSAYFVAAYDTPYAYGIWADESYIYLCDRDESLMIFENLNSM